jgi:hypothetical protein
MLSITKMQKRVAYWRLIDLASLSMSISEDGNQNEIKSAMVRNEEGFELAIFKTVEGIVWLDFSLSDNNFDELSQNELPIFQIDDKKPVKMIRGFTATIVPADEGI